MEQNTSITPPSSVVPQVTPAAQHEKSVRFRIALLGFFLFLVFIVGLFWMFTTPNMTVGLTLSFVAGLSMIFLPCTLPLAFVIVPLTMGKDPKKGLLMALSFTFGLTITLSFYGVFIAALGRSFGLKSDAEVYAVLFGGIAAFIFGLSEIGLINFRLPSYSGKFPDFIQRQKDYMKTFLLGLLLGNAGVGCPNPAFYILLGYIATVGDLFNGWFLGFIHGVGRSVPLIFLAILGTLGVNALSGISRHKEAVERSMGWMLVIIGAYLLTFGIFGHDWFIASGIHGGWENFVNSIGGERFGEVILKHEHKLVNVSNWIQYGNMFFLGLLALTFLVAFIVKRPSRRVMLSLSAIYIVLALVIGYSTGWTFKTSTGGHIQIQFRGETPAPHEEGMMEDEHGGSGTMDEDGHEETLYHEENEVREGVAVNLNVTPVPFKTGQTQKLDFFVNQKPGNVPVPAENLEIEHAKLMHVIGVRNDMNEFFHIHPNPVSTPGHLLVDHVFSKPGLYKIWSEIKKEGTNHAFGHPEILIAGEGSRDEKRVSFGRNVVTGLYQVALKVDEPVVKGHEHDLSFDVHTFDGDEVEVEDYLAAKMHLTVIKDDWKQFIHIHPVSDEEHHALGESMKIADTEKQNIFRVPKITNGAHPEEEGNHALLKSHFNSAASEVGLHEALAHGVEEVPGEIHEGGADKTINFHVVFLEAGPYKIFAQFRPQGIDLSPDEALTASFWIKVEEKAPLALSGWWINLLWSVAAIVILGFLVKKYLKKAE